MNVSVTEAKNRLTELLTAVEAGERVVIQRHGKPIAEIVRTADAPKPTPKFGTWGKLSDVELDPDWHKPIEDLEAFLRGAL